MTKSWISVSKNLPEPWDSVLGYVVGGGLVLAGGDDSMCDVVSWSGNAWLQSVGGEDRSVTVTHWMPLPDAPTIGEAIADD